MPEHFKITALMGLENMIIDEILARGILTDYGSDYDNLFSLDWLAKRHLKLYNDPGFYQNIKYSLMADYK